ncbi:Putative alpha/beta hydrolase-1, NACHT nucleoside triphosphatase [Colletotrichum destructivum]|uniref:Alpha/beta hydrolase-1, NACHT nucleoside triphosphatase n=1 Tax=Colletotrichum destructivum TaxID=34406 RepID=A0AAX4IY00_9PEZI|nr:Putative alpha/beta hydrolase-1, NACHT nucleoside triphosphatase [Colletotrichum destructivum]
MDGVRSWLVLLIAGVAGVITYLWLSAKTKQSPVSRPRSHAVQESSVEDSPPKTPKTRENHARPPLEVLFPSPTDTNDDAEVDIIAVHGLGSNVDWSWTWKDGEKRVNWLRDHDMLPARVPKSRIMVYNYESRWHADAPKTRLQLCGEQLVQNVHSFRRDAPTRPIVFVGHSLGGNVIVQALLHASVEDKYKGVLGATAGVVFLGTPFRGTKWQPFLDFLAQLMAPAGSHRGVTRELEYDGPELRDRLHRFCRLRNMLSMPVSCFFELFETDYGRRLGLPPRKGMVIMRDPVNVKNPFSHLQIVDEASACIPGLDRQGLEADHLTINKYRGPDDGGFKQVSEVIHEMCDNANNVIRRRHDHALRQRPEARACLRDLFVTDPLEDKKALKRKKGDRARGTCKWIMGAEELTTWLDPGQTTHSEGQASQVLWLHGNPGTGKSTMAIFLTEELSEIFSAMEGKTLAYFFCDSTFDKRNTATSVIRGLLLQLLQQHPQLLDYLLPKYNERGAGLFNSFDALWGKLLEVAADKNTGRKYCIIDAVDECDPKSQTTLLQQLKETFRGRNAPPNLHILVTSRSYDEIREHLDNFLNKDLASYPEAKKDVDRCIKEKTANLAEMKRYTDTIRKKVSDLLREKAEGTFLWVGLACKELEGIPSKDAVKTLRNMPKGLHSLYEKLLETAVNGNGANNIHRVLSFVAMCVRPLSVLELSDACQLHLDEKDEETRAQFTREQIASCRLMVVVQNEKVLLLHQSVKDFLAEARFFNDLEAHANLAYRCVDLLIEDFHNKQPRIRFLDYAIKEWANHARMAKSKFEVKASQAEFFAPRSKCWAFWLKSYQNRYYWRMVLKTSSLLHIAAYCGVSPLVEHVCRRDNQNNNAPGILRLINSTDDNGMTPLEYAAKTGHVETISLLMGFGARVSEEEMKAATENSVNAKQVLVLFLDRQGDQISITEKLIVATARSFTDPKGLMELLLDRQGDQITITEQLVIAAAGNFKNPRGLMDLLLHQRGDQITITEKVVIAAARNREDPRGLMEVLFDRRGDQIIITEQVVIAAAGNFKNPRGLIDLLLDRRGDQIIITEQVLMAATKNRRKGNELIALLLNRRGHQFKVTEKIACAAESNSMCGMRVLKTLLDRRREELAQSGSVELAI